MDSQLNAARILLVLVVLGLQAHACFPPAGTPGTPGSCGVCGGTPSCNTPPIPSPCCAGPAPSCGCGGGGGCGRYGCYNVKRSKLAIASARTEEVFGFGQHGKSRKSQLQAPAPSFGRAAHNEAKQLLETSGLVAFNAQTEPNSPMKNPMEHHMEQPSPLTADNGAKELLETNGLVSFKAKTEPDSPMEKPMEHQRDQPLGPDERFMRCCVGRKLPDACLSHCSFQTYTRQALTRMYTKQDACPIYAAAEIHFCAAQGQDHRPCCTRSGVANTLAGKQCLVFCDQRPGKITKLDLTYLACFDRFETMKACFWHGMGQKSKQKVNIFA